LNTFFRFDLVPVERGPEDRGGWFCGNDRAVHFAPEKAALPSFFLMVIFRETPKNTIV
jgi:hypothetical protein